MSIFESIVTIDDVPEVWDKFKEIVITNENVQDAIESYELRYGDYKNLKSFLNSYSYLLEALEECFEYAELNEEYEVCAKLMKVIPAMFTKNNLIVSETVEHSYV